MDGLAPNGTHAGLLLGLILGFEPRLIRLDKLPKLGSVRKQRVPLFQIKGDWESTKTVDRDATFLGYLETQTAALG